MADAYTAHSIDPFEVYNTAASKPIGYMPYNPSLGVGGHCIPINPYYLLSNSDIPLLEAAAKKMNIRPAKIVGELLASLSPKGSRRDSGVIITKQVLIVSIGFKARQSHLVNSPGLQLTTELTKYNEVDLLFADPLVYQDDVPQILRLADEDWTKEKLETVDLIVVAFRQ